MKIYEFQYKGDEKIKAQLAKSKVLSASSHKDVISTLVVKKIWFFRHNPFNSPADHMAMLNFDVVEKLVSLGEKAEQVRPIIKAIEDIFGSFICASKDLLEDGPD